MARDYAVVGILVAVLAVFSVQQFNTFMGSMRQNVRVQSATLRPQEPLPRNYAINRSVLDDTVTTGSISGRPVVLDPCTGQVKSK